MYAVKLRGSDLSNWQSVTESIIVDVQEWKKDAASLCFSTRAEAQELYMFMLMHRRGSFHAIKVCKMAPKLPHLEYEVLEYHESR